jgi:hypothetical protein
MSRKSVVDDYDWIRMERDRIRREREAAEEAKREQDAPDFTRDFDYNGDAP